MHSSNVIKQPSTMLNPYSSREQTFTNLRSAPEGTVPDFLFVKSEVQTVPLILGQPVGAAGDDVEDMNKDYEDPESVVGVI